MAMTQRGMRRQTFSKGNYQLVGERYCYENSFGGYGIGWSTPSIALFSRVMADTTASLCSQCWESGIRLF